MTDQVRLPRKLSEEPDAPEPRRPSHRKVIEQLDRWANSPGLQPPRAPRCEHEIVLSPTHSNNVSNSRDFGLKSSLPDCRADDSAI